MACHSHFFMIFYDFLPFEAWMVRPLVLVMGDVFPNQCMTRIPEDPGIPPGISSHSPRQELSELGCVSFHSDMVPSSWNDFPGHGCVPPSNKSRWMLPAIAAHAATSCQRARCWRWKHHNWHRFDWFRMFGSAPEKEHLEESKIFQDLTRWSIFRAARGIMFWSMTFQVLTFQALKVTLESYCVCMCLPGLPHQPCLLPIYNRQIIIAYHSVSTLIN